MGYHTMGLCVAAQTPTKAPPPPLTREQCREHGRQLFALLRREVDAAIHELPELPQPKGLLQDLVRERAASIETYGAAYAVLAIVLPAERFERIGLALWGYLASLRPDADPCLVTAWEQSTLASATADVSQARAVRSADQRDPVALTVAAEQTAHELVRGRHLLTAIRRRLRVVQQTPRHAAGVV